MIRHLTPVYNYCSLLSFIILNLIMIPTILTTKISPCRVRNLVAQPQFGISASTKKMVDIMQIPPLFTQTLQIGICLDDNKSFSDLTQPDSLSHYICRQRYSAVEIYSKSEGGSNQKSLQSPVAPENPKDRLLQKLVKNFVIVEAGCDFSFNFLPVIDYHKKKDYSKEQFYSPEVVGMSSLHEGVKATKDLNLEVTNVVEAAEAQMGSKTSILSPRSLHVRRNNFFRREWHFNSNRNKSLVETNSSKTSQSQGQGEPTKDSISKTSTSSLESVNNDEEAVPPSSEDEDVKDVRELQQEEKEEEKVEALEGEFYIKPEDFGLPILFLDASLDPVMNIISRYSD